MGVRNNYPYFKGRKSFEATEGVWYEFCNLAVSLFNESTQHTLNEFPSAEPGLSTEEGNEDPET